MKKKFKKPKKIQLPKVQRPFKRAKPTEEKVNEALSGVPRITNETVAEHREEVLSSARKYIYPLQHSKNRVVRTSIALFLAVIIAFLVFCGLDLYKFQSTGGFVYGVTRVLPFPVAKAGHSWVSYESYLFELRRNMHYYQTQQQADFGSKTGKEQLTRLKKQAMAQVIQDAYVKQLAKANQVSVSQQAVDNEVALVRSQNRLGNNDRVFKDVLKQFWGWDQTDFKRELRQQLLQQDVVAKLDTATNARANTAIQQIKSGADFATVATTSSDDASTKANGGQYQATITPTDRNVAPIILQTLNKLGAGQTSDIVNTGYTLEILKVVDKSPTSLHAAHIQFTFQPIDTYVVPLRDKNVPHQFIRF
ncbi:MAG TPA: SurA N-terminal domain-containing protein [Candidatus Saccharimonadales bacterium]